MNFQLFGPKGDQLLPFFTNAGAPSNGTSGTYAGLAIKGALLIDVTNGTLYQNTNTKASPTWTQLTAAAAGTLTTLLVSSTSEFQDVVSVTDDTQSTTAANGAVVVTGGVGVAKNANVGGALGVTGAATIGGALSVSAAAALSAAGSTRADATQLTKTINKVGTVGSGQGLILPTAGNLAIVDHQGANNAKIYAAGSATIDGTAGNTGITMTKLTRALFLQVATDTWISMVLGAAVT